MQRGSAADLRRRFRTGRACLDLVHTGGEGELAQFEIIDSPADLGRLLGVILDLPPLPAEDADLPCLRALRAALTRIAHGLADGPSSPIPVDPPRPDDRATLTAVAATPTLVPALGPDGASTVVAPTAAAALSHVARDAVDLFGGPLARRIRVCAGDNCGLLLLDTSRAGQRRWCSMELCGNRAKVRAHRSGPLA